MDIKINGDYITLGQFLKLTNFISSGGEAKLALKELAITVNGETENRRGRKLRISDVIIIEGSKFHIV
ncbi:S4 domain-containing protein YaaA [bacterium c-19]|nr:S4 domain-containing protein YaaA [bacterium c-19]